MLTSDKYTIGGTLRIPHNIAPAGGYPKPTCQGHGFTEPTFDPEASPASPHTGEATKTNEGLLQTSDPQ